MLRMTLKYTNFNDEEVTKDFYFHLSKAEAMKMVADDNLMARLFKMGQERDKLAILQQYENLIRQSVGVRSEDGETFVRNEKTQSLLFDSPAIDALISEIFKDDTSAVNFFINLFPKDMQQQLNSSIEEIKKDPEKANLFAMPEDNRAAWEKEHRRPTQAELQSMSREEMQRAFATFGKQ